MNAVVEQGTEAWLKERVGHATGSRFADVMARLKSGAPGADRKNYLTEIVTERFTGQPFSPFVTPAMRYGKEQEPAAKAAYMLVVNQTVDPVGFIKHKSMMAGVSPDGIVNLDRGLELKCPFNSTNHLDYLLNGMPDEYKAQVQGGMWITGYDTWDFVSYDPRMPAKMQLMIQTIKRDNAFIKQLEDDVVSFLADVDNIYKTLKQKFNA